MSGPSEIDTGNASLVGVRGDHITVLLPARTLTPTEALVHAAWLVAMADTIDPGAAAQFAEVYAAVMST